MTSARYAWIKNRGRGIHVTIRDVDCEGFDVPRMIKDFCEMGVTFFSFFAGGYVTTYPTNLAFQRQSPWLKGRDLTGEIVACAHENGLRVVPMIDLAMLPEHAWKAHPEWAFAGADHKPILQAENLYASCPMGGYVRNYCAEMVREILGRYDVDAMKFGGGSYGFLKAPCHCERCTQSYHDETGKDIPQATDWENLEWKRFAQWRTGKTSQTVQHLVAMVHAIRPGMPVLGNAVCFGDPNWTVNSSLDIEVLASIEDVVQVEVQTRAWNNQPDGQAYWQYLRWPAETAAYMTSVCDKPVWAVASYFCAWPWRRLAVPVAEQKAYLALAIAHGASPLVNLSGGAPAVHEDKRGFQAIRELYQFMGTNNALIDGDTSAAEIALVYDHNTLMYYGNEEAGDRYIDEIRGFEEALFQKHVPFDIISTVVLERDRTFPYKAIILPNCAALPAKSVDAIERYVNEGGNVFASFQTGMRNELGEWEVSGKLSQLLGVRVAGMPEPCTGAMAGAVQAYAARKQDHPVLQNLGNCTLMPLSGQFVPVECAPQARALYTRQNPFRVFPEGWSYPKGTAPDNPVLIEHSAPGKGVVLYCAAELGKTFWQSRFPDVGILIADAVLWLSGDKPPVIVDGPSSLHVSLRRVNHSIVVHCVNLTGGERFFTSLVPLHNVTIGVRSDLVGSGPVRRASDGAELKISLHEGYVWAVIPVLQDYDLIEFKN